MINTRGYPNQNSHLTSWLLARRYDQITQGADHLFRQICADPVLVEYMVSLPLGRLPEIRRALSVRAAQRKEAALEDAVRAAIVRDWRQLSLMQVDRAVDAYLCALGRVLLSGHRVPRTPTVLLEDNSHVC
jgi:hypothetical protein